MLVLSRSRRGVALVSTVLLATVAAAVALVIVDQALRSTRTEAQRIDGLEARTQALESLEQIEVQLGIDPWFFYHSVAANERARVCVHDDDRVVEPGDLWPVECGITWTYVEAATPGPVRVEYLAPSLTDPTLTVRVLARAFDTEAGVQASYVTNASDRFTLASVDDLDVSLLPGTIRGGLASAGTLSYDAASATGVTMTAETLSPDPVVSGAASDPTNRFAEFPEGPIVAHATTAELRSSVPALVERSCPSTIPKLLGSHATSLCITPGAELLAADDTTFTVPDQTTAVLLIFTEEEDTVAVYTRTGSSSYPTSCLSPCDLAAASLASLSAGTHPGGMNHWALAGTAALPVSGVIGSSVDTVVSLCGSEFATAAACAARTGTLPTPGMTVPAPVTVVAGSTTAPADITIGGPLALADGASFGAVATGQIVLPYWARPQAQNLDVTGSFFALGMATADDAFVSLHRRLLRILVWEDDPRRSIERWLDGRARGAEGARLEGRGRLRDR